MCDILPQPDINEKHLNIAEPLSEFLLIFIFDSCLYVSV